MHFQTVSLDRNRLYFAIDTVLGDRRADYKDGSSTSQTKIDKKMVIISEASYNKSHLHDSLPDKVSFES